MPQVGEVWKYNGNNRDRFGVEYRILELLPAMKEPNWDWKPGVKYAPLDPVATAPENFVRFTHDFVNCFKYVRG